MNKLRRFFQKHGLTIAYVTQKNRFLEFINLIEPLSSGQEMLRVGGIHDGGYFVPSDFEGVDCLISPGVGSTWNFERQVWSDFSIPAIMVDGSVQKPPGLPPSFLFIDKFLGVTSSHNQITLRELVNVASDKFGEGDLMLQMDIEGSEIDILKHMDEITLKKFRILIIEFHYLDLWEINEYFVQYITPVFEKLLTHHKVVSVASNKHGRTFEIHERYMPSALEFVFLRADRFGSGPNAITSFDEWASKGDVRTRKAFGSVR